MQQNVPNFDFIDKIFRNKIKICLKFWRMILSECSKKTLLWKLQNLAKRSKTGLAARSKTGQKIHHQGFGTFCSAPLSNGDFLLRRRNVCPPLHSASAPFRSGQTFRLRQKITVTQLRAAKRSESFND